MLVGIPKEIKVHEYRVGVPRQGCASWSITAIR
jgi:alanine dehydrogenase